MPGIAPKPGAHPWIINDFSEHKEAALQVLSYLISSEYQLQYRMRMGTPSVSLSQEDGKLFGADDPTYTDKMSLQCSKIHLLNRLHVKSMGSACCVQ